MTGPARLSPLFTWRGAVVESELPSTARHVALTLSLHMSERGSSCFPSIPTLARETGLHYDTVRSHLTQLAEAGWLVKDVRRSGKGRGTQVQYTATVPTNMAENTGGLDHVGHDQRGPGPETNVVQDHCPTKEEDVNEDVSSTKRARRPSDDIFDALVEACEMEYSEMTDQAKRGCGVAAAELVRVGASVGDVLARASVYRRKFEHAALTPSALARQWAACRPPAEGRRASKDMFDERGRQFRQRADGTREYLDDEVAE